MSKHRTPVVLPRDMVLLSCGHRAPLEDVVKSKSKVETVHCNVCCIQLTEVEIDGNVCYRRVIQKPHE